MFYYIDMNVFFGVSIGFGKTISVELSMMKVFCDFFGLKVVYIVLFKVLV